MHDQRVPYLQPKEIAINSNTRPKNSFGYICPSAHKEIGKDIKIRFT